MKYAVIPGLILLLAVSADAAVKTETVEYRIGDATFQGYLAYDDSIRGKSPGVLVIHEWKGLDA